MKNRECLKRRIIDTAARHRPVNGSRCTFPITFSFPFPPRQSSMFLPPPLFLSLSTPLQLLTYLAQSQANYVILFLLWFWFWLWFSYFFYICFQLKVNSAVLLHQKLPFSLSLSLALFGAATATANRLNNAAKQTKKKKKKKN